MIDTALNEEAHGALDFLVNKRIASGSVVDKGHQDGWVIVEEFKPHGTRMSNAFYLSCYKQIHCRGG